MNEEEWNKRARAIYTEKQPLQWIKEWVSLPGNNDMFGSHFWRSRLILLSRNVVNELSLLSGCVPVEPLALPFQVFTLSLIDRGMTLGMVTVDGRPDDTYFLLGMTVVAHGDSIKVLSHAWKPVYLPGIDGVASKMNTAVVDYKIVDGVWHHRAGKETVYIPLGSFWGDNSDPEILWRLFNHLIPGMRGRNASQGPLHKRLQGRFKGSDGQYKEAVHSSVIYIRGKKERRGDGETDIEFPKSYSCRWRVRGHWRRIRGIGHDPAGELVPGKTWISDYVAGPSDKPLIEKVRFVGEPPPPAE